MARKYLKGVRGAVPSYTDPKDLRAQIDSYCQQCLTSHPDQWTRDKNGKPYQTDCFVGPSMEGLAFFCGFQSVTSFNEIAKKKAFNDISAYAHDKVRETYQRLCDAGAILPLIAKAKLAHLGIRDSQKLELSGSLTVNWKDVSDKAAALARKALKGTTVPTHSGSK